MADKKVDDDELLSALVAVFQEHGCDGASLSRISEATGLGRASLYHRFPGGKEDMADAVLEGVQHWITEHLLGHAAGEEPPHKRVQAMVREMSGFFDGGSRSCVLDTMSVGQGSPRIKERIRCVLEAWRDAMAHVARVGGVPAKDARHRAEEALLRIQGALVLARGLGDRRPFQRVMRELPDLLLEPSH